MTTAIPLTAQPAAATPPSGTVAAPADVIVALIVSVLHVTTDLPVVIVALVLVSVVAPGLTDNAA